MAKLIAWILRLLITGAERSVIARELGIADIVTLLPFALPQPFMIGKAVSAVAKRHGMQEDRIKNITRVGVLIQFKDAQDANSEYEAALKLNIFFDDHTFTSVFVYSDGTHQELRPQ